MKTNNFRTITIVFVLLSLAIPTIAQETRSASCIIKVTADPAVLPINTDFLDDLIHSSAVIGKAGRDVLEISHEQALQLIEIIPLSGAGMGGFGPGTGGVGMGMIGVEEYNDPPSKSRIYSETLSPDLSLHDELLKNKSNKVAAPPTSTTSRMTKTQTPSSRQITSPIYKPAPQIVIPEEKSVVLTLKVDLSTEDLKIKPAAEQFLKAITTNLRNVLLEGHDEHLGRLNDHIRYVDVEIKAAQEALDQAMGRKTKTPADYYTEEQLEKEVDLSGLTEETSFQKAVEYLLHSVDPPLKAVVLWIDLFKVGVDGSTPIGISGRTLIGVPLRKGLRLVLKGIDSGAGKVWYSIEDGVITIATEESLTTKYQQAQQDANTGLSSNTLVLEKSNLTSQKQTCEIKISRSKARCKAIEKQMLVLSKQIEEKTQNDPVTSELKNVLEIHLRRVEAAERLFESGKKSIAELEDIREKLSIAKIDLARRQEEIRRTVGGDQLESYKDELANLTIELAEDMAGLQEIQKRLAQVEIQLKNAVILEAQASKIQLAEARLIKAQTRLDTLRSRQNTFSRPTVTVIGIE
ncbi:MAG: hypothetical protein ACETWQ_03945 [Phycisphaerae bacterium]